MTTINVPNDESTIQDAIDSASSGDTINVESGTFKQDIEIKENNLTLSGDGVDSTTIEGQVFVPSENSRSAGSVSGLTMRNFTVESGNGGGQSLDIETGGKNAASQTDLEFSHNEFVAPDDGLAVVAGNIKNVIFNNNTFSVNSGDTAEKLVFVGGERSFGSNRSSDSVKFINNTFTGDVSDINGGAVALEHEASKSGGTVDGKIDGNDFSGVNLADSNDLIAAAFGDGDSGPDKNTRAAITGSIGVDVKGESSVGNEIQPVVDFAVQNEEVNVESGEFDEQVTIGVKGLSLKGPNNGTSGDDSSNRSNEATLRDTLNISGVSHVTVDGFKIAEKSSNKLVSGISIQPNNDSNITIKNNIIKNISKPGGGGTGDFSFGVLSFGGAISGVKIKQNKISDIGSKNSSQGLGVSLQQLDPGNNPSAGDGADIRDNTIKNIETKTPDKTARPGTGIALRPNFSGDDSAADVKNSNSFDNMDIAVSHPKNDTVDENLTNVATVVVDDVDTGNEQRIFTLTIQNAVDAAEKRGANTDDEIEVRSRDDNGAYDERVVLNRDDDNSGTLTLTSPDGATPEISKTDNNGEPTIAVDRDGVTIKNLKITRTATNDRVAQAVRVAGNNITLKNNNCKIEGSDNAAIAVLTDSSGAAGNPSFTGTIGSVTIDGGTITASTDGNANGEVGVAIADSGSASFSNTPAVTINSVTLKTDEGNDYLVEQGTGGGVVGLQSVLKNNTFNPNTNASGVSVSDSDRSEFGLSVDGLVASTIQDAVNNTAEDADIKIKDGTYNEEVTIGKNITLTKATGTPTISGQVRITGAVGGSNPLEVSELEINYDSNNAGSGKKSTVLFEQKQHLNVTFDNNTIIAPSDGFAVYKNKSGGGTSSPDNNVTLSNNTFDTNGGTANQLVVIRSEVEGVSNPSLPNSNSVTIDNNDFNGTINRPSGLRDQRGSALDHRAESGDIQDNQFGGVSGADIEPIASATGANTSIKKNGDGGNSGLNFEGESAAGDNLQTELDKNDPGEAVRINNVSGNGEFEIDAQNGTNQNKIQIPDNLSKSVTITGSDKTSDPELQVPDGGTGIEVNKSGTSINNLSIKGPSNNSGTAIDVSKSNTAIEDVEIGSGSAPDTGVKINDSGCTLRDSTITVNPIAAIEIDGGADNVIEDSTLRTASGASGGAGVLVNNTGGSGNLIALNDIDSEFDNGVDIENNANASNVTVRFNNLRGRDAGVRNKDSEDVDARSNFWNDKTGPGGDVDDPETGRTADGDGSAIDNGSNDGQVRYDEFLEISNDFILNTGSPSSGRDTDGDGLHEDFNDDNDHFPTDGYLFLRALRQGHFERLAAIDNPGGDLSTNYTERFDFDGDGADDITRDDVNEMVINRNR